MGLDQNVLGKVFLTFALTCCDFRILEQNAEFIHS